MALDRDDGFKHAERLLRQGKVPAAVGELQDLARRFPRDGLLLNRAGDLLARVGRPSDAIGFYEKLAELYAAGGFLPKAVAIHKKILKLEPERPATLLQLGELHVTQQHPGEARSCLLRAAERYITERNLAAAREVYRRLVAIEPGDPRHRVRLAETRAAEGQVDEAGKELLDLGHTLMESGRIKDAERSYQRAAELLATPSEALCGLALSLAAQERHEEAETALERAGPHCGEEPLAGLRAVVAEIGGRADDAGRILIEADSPTSVETYLTWMLHRATPGGRRGDPWERLDSLLERWGATERALGLLARLVELEEQGHLPALERLYQASREQGHPEEAQRALERMIQAFQARSMTSEVRRLLDELRQEFPGSPLVAANAASPSAAGRAAPEGRRRPAGRAVAGKPAAGRQASGEPAGAEETSASPSEDPLLEAEAPAVPLTPADEEFVSGQMTEAEVLQKYGLASEAVQRLRAIADRFPGHVEALVKLATLVRSQGDRGAHSEVLAQLAIARRAAGDLDGARDAAREATDRKPLSPERRHLLEQLSLIDAPATPAEAPAPAQAPPAAPELAAEPQPGGRSPEPSPVEPREGSGDEVEIVFGDDEPEAAPARPAAPPARRTPPPDLLQEIAFYREQGMTGEARHKIEALRTLGYSGPAIDELESSLGAPAATAGPEPSSVRLDAGDLDELAAALEAEIEEADSGGDAGAAGEESLEEVFEAFKRQVEDEVGSEDFRTHYDLGIAYKEMGLVNDALKEFEIASRAPELFREACSMLALCQRQRGEIDEAARWYQKALEAPGGTAEELQGLRYDLAEVLMQQGDERGALDLLRDIFEVDPGYRDVRSRVDELRSRLGN